MTTIINGSSPSVTFSDSTTQTTAFTTNPIVNNIKSEASTPLTFAINTTEAMRIASNGVLLLGTTTEGGKFTISWASASTSALVTRSTSETYNGSPIVFQNSSGGTSGFISQGTSSVGYNTSSDYRLKDNIAPMTGALATVSALKPVTYKWKADGSNGQGFIAHELAEVCPEAVSGEKDAVNEDGSIKAQGIDTSFLVATLTAAIQELNAKVTELEAKVK